MPLRTEVTANLAISWGEEWEQAQEAGASRAAQEKAGLAGQFGTAVL